MENTSGQGSHAVVPKEIKGWNWGAFLLTWIWGIGNNVWLALIVLSRDFHLAVQRIRRCPRSVSAQRQQVGFN